MASFTDQKVRVATEDECRASWGGEKNGKRFRCYLCGEPIKPGDKWRWIYANGRTQEINGKTYGVTNLIVRECCDGDIEDVRDRWLSLNTEFYGPRFWALR